MVKQQKTTKQILLLLIILLAVVGMIGAGCLNKDQTNNTENNGSNSNSSNSAASNNTSNNNTNNNNTDSRNNTSASVNNTSSNTTPTSFSSLPDVVVANHDGGSGGGKSSGSGSNYAAEAAGQKMILESQSGEDGTKLCIYVPVADISGETLTVTFGSSVSEVSETFNEAILSAVPEISGKNVTAVMNDALDVGDFEAGGSEPTAISFSVTAGGATYDVYLMASSIINVDAGSNGKIELIDNKDTYLYTGTKTVACDINIPIKLTVVPDDGYYVQSFVVTKSGTEVYNSTVPAAFDADPSESAVYNVTAVFKKQIAATYDGEDTYIDQDLNAENNIYAYVPAAEASGKVLTFEFLSTVNDVTDVNADIISEEDGDTIISGKTVTVTIKDAVDSASFEKGGTPTPSDLTFSVTVAGGSVYNVYILDSAAIKIVVPDGCTITSSGVVPGGLNLDSAGTYYHVCDIGSTNTFTASDGFELTLTKSGADVTPFDGSITFESASYVLTAVPSVA
ncbi:hypothetical protein MmiEs2_03820 [Methanimicrococcus stummii]|uniref:Uncharacterized protein n=1 Tax=Methanimicrococcus stummii TaxID=3028294 RepID=A0AA96V8K9_9EURY|nr:hypothetical protein [Methanimicrococcus sp. Es2]WNY28198.1 hypothetical protein MmiEs2_03820 [Methanimicrococcus sp. Es2]